MAAKTTAGRSNCAPKRSSSVAPTMVPTRTPLAVGARSVMASISGVEIGSRSVIMVSLARSTVPWHYRLA